MVRSELRQLVEDVLAPIIYTPLSELGGDYSVNVDRSMTPQVNIDTGDDKCRIRVHSRSITRRSDGALGWEFVPVVVNASMTERIDVANMGEVGARFKRWAKIADVAEKLFEVEFYPADYEEGE